MTVKASPLTPAPEPHGRQRERLLAATEDMMAKVKIGVEEYEAEVIIQLKRKDGTRVNVPTHINPEFALWLAKETP